MFEDIPLTQQQRELYVDAWCKRHKEANGLIGSNADMHAQVALYDDVYKNLDTLDTKTGALVQAASVVFAVLSLIFQFYISKGGGNSGSVPFLIFSGTFFSLLSVGACLGVIMVKWTSTADLDKKYTGEMLRRMIKLKSQRTVLYRAGWWMLCISFTCLGFFFLSFVQNVRLQVG